MISSSLSPNQYQQQKHHKTNTFLPIFLLIPVRLGLQHPEREYSLPIQYLLSLPFSVGIVGGKPNSSYWFYGCREDYVYYKDPHQTQQTVVKEKEKETKDNKDNKDKDKALDIDIISIDKDSIDSENEDLDDLQPIYVDNLDVDKIQLNTYHESAYHGKRLIIDMDPSMCFGFLFLNSKEWETFKEQVKELKFDRMPFSIQDDGKDSFGFRDDGNYQV
ncbi:MAG: hypothetical protein EZS28_009485 [Streblomastix strix]|uniref:Cysteine protease n=1 Tax=Streblomastix strix TaxID=222440 RepID=A0A5J4WKV7_9EUKA|nr:MAG: hypothetical protein EZS28_009485 [Streblomastix strix]